MYVDTHPHAIRMYVYMYSFYNTHSISIVCMQCIAALFANIIPLEMCIEGVRVRGVGGVRGVCEQEQEEEVCCRLPHPGHRFASEGTG